ncbi:MAG: hypothetical protein MJ131_01030 [Lachnospiraceae bacterium]|nr:hypothetical protein [Lachnospiraceae bacterium]
MMLLVSIQTKVYAYENLEDNESQATLIKGDTENSMPSPQLLGTEYVVVVPSAAIRSGPGYNYPALGTMHYGDIIMVSSIVDGWARFYIARTWRYLPISSLELLD